MVCMNVKFSEGIWKKQQQESVTGLDFKAYPGDYPMESCEKFCRRSLSPSMVIIVIAQMAMETEA